MENKGAAYTTGSVITQGFLGFAEAKEGLMATESLFNAWHIREKADIEMIAKALEESDRREEEPSFPEAHVLRGKELEEFLKGK